MPTPMNSSVKLSHAMSPKSAEDIRKMDSVPYRQTVGSPLYLVSGSRPDIANAVGQVCRYMENPGQSHWSAVKHILRYLKGTIDHGVLLGGTQALTLKGFADADWGSDVDSRRSTTGYVYFFGDSPISWASKFQRTVALSSTEAEYMALSTASQEAIWLQTLLSDFGQPHHGSIPIFEDNQGAIKLTLGTKDHSRTKHIDVRYHFIRDHVSNGNIQIYHVPTQHNTADLMTKALPPAGFHRHAKSLVSV